MSRFFSPLVEEAIELAAEWHEGTYRKGRWREPMCPPPDASIARVPTMAHVTTVAMTVARAGWGDEAIAAAFLHDALEDADRWTRDLSRDVLASRVGEEVVRIIEAVSEPQRDAEGNRLRWRVRKEAYIASLTAGPPEVAAVALADKLHNAYSIASSIESGVDVFTSAPGRQALSSDGAAQLWFLNAALAATKHHHDPRLEPMREAVQHQIERLSEAVASS
ncbi:MAG: HD domain-containing protein [Rubricoccaceae bacterium]